MGQWLPLGYDLRILNNVDKIYIRESGVGCGESEKAQAARAERRCRLHGQREGAGCTGREKVQAARASGRGSTAIYAAAE